MPPVKEKQTTSRSLSVARERRRYGEREVEFQTLLFLPDLSGELESSEMLLLDDNTGGNFLTEVTLE